MVTICFGTVAPSLENVGGEIITRCLRKTGYTVIDLGENVTAQKIDKVISKTNPDLIALSCSDTSCFENMEKIIVIADKNNIPVLIGGAAASLHHIALLRTALHTPFVYYSRNTSDVLSVIEKALKHEKPDSPKSGTGRVFELSGKEKNISDALGFSILEGNIEDIVIREGTRQWCGNCPGNLNHTCPLSSGYTIQKSLEESKTFIRHFRKVFLICLPVLSKEEREIQRERRKEIWLGMKNFELLFSKRYSDILLFKLPIQCPLCEPQDCLIPEKECRQPDYQFPMHEEYNIDMMETARTIAGDRSTLEMYALLLADSFPDQKINEE